MMTVLLTALVLGVFIPIVQATNGTANEVRGRVRRRRLSLKDGDRSRRWPSCAPR